MTNQAPSMSKSLPTIELGGLRLHALTEEACIGHILSELKEGRGGWVVTPNLDHLRRFQHDIDFRALVAQANLVTADGMPLIWMSRIQGTLLPERVAGSSLINTLSRAAAREGMSVFLLGGDPGTAQEAGAILCQRNPGLRLAGTSCPQIGPVLEDSTRQRLAAELAAALPDIVFVGLGSPKQERVIANLRGCVPAAWWLGVGVSFSFVCNRVHRAPVWMQKLGLEWLHRLWQEPGRLARRYLIEGLPFAAIMFARCSCRRLFGRPKNWTKSA
ncbi:MAG TPA: WecB/TagA/CpsF family glycosyltransferase [Gemmataceae bacterium]|jgi:N-acetylglucosaminyldiphosphoundecaprenol N-acetyl-beta-D-mannosaminyltransferase|nr:WecB/TagA/CpsF family glycosyltransferase [Gemmataceae bacterium]